MAQRQLLSVGSGPEPTLATVRAGSGELCHHDGGRFDRLLRFTRSTCVSLAALVRPPTGVARELVWACLVEGEEFTF